MTRWRGVAAGWVVLFAGVVLLAMVGAAPCAAPPAFVPGELIVTFDAGLPACGESPRPGCVAELAGAVARLEAQVDVPLRPGVAVSGSAWVVRIDAARVLDGAERALLELLAPHGVEVVRSTPIARTRFTGVEGDRALHATLGPEEDAAELLDAAAKALSLPLVRQAAPPRELALRVDWPELTRVVARKLRSSTGVASVEFNEVAAPFVHSP